MQIQIYKITSTLCAALILNHKVYGENQNSLEISAVDTGMMMMMMMMVIMMKMMVDGLEVVDVLEGVASSYAALDLYTTPPIISS